MGAIRIISRSSRPFEDRSEAGQLLAEPLAELRGQNPVVLGIPRGGLLVARELARGLQGELDVVLVRKLRAPLNPELAIGSISEGGRAFLDDLVIAHLSVPDSYIELEKASQLRDIEQRGERYRQVRPKVPLRGRLVVVTDDGLATGATMRAALTSARAEGPARLVAAVPVGAEPTLHSLADAADEFICLRVPPYFRAVGEFYHRFLQVGDDEVRQVLEEAVRGGVRDGEP